MFLIGIPEGTEQVPNCEELRVMTRVRIFGIISIQNGSLTLGSVLSFFSAFPQLDRELPGGINNRCHPLSTPADDTWGPLTGIEFTSQCDFIMKSDGKRGM